MARSAPRTLGGENSQWVGDWWRWPPFVEESWTRGMVRDMPRIAIPQGGVYDAADFLLHQPGFAQKRGGTSYAGPACGSATYMETVTYADFPAGPKLVAVGKDHNLYTITAGTTTNVGALGIGPLSPPKLFTGGTLALLVLCSTGFSAPKTYNGVSTIATLGGSPPNGRLVEIFKSHVVLAGSQTNWNRIWFSPIPDPTTTWDTTNAWMDADHRLTGLACLRNMIIAFSSGFTERFVGTTPPPGSDFDHAPVGAIGCTDPRSIVTLEDQVVFANPKGVFTTNGSGFRCLTAEGNIESYWQSLFSGYVTPLDPDTDTWTISCGLFRKNYLLVSVLNGTTLQGALMCNLHNSAWWRLTNVKASMFSNSIGTDDELYYADRNANRVLKTSGMFSPAAGNKNDADGTAVTPTLELRPLGNGSGITTYSFGRVSYDMRDAASDNPTLAVTCETGIEADTTFNPPESPITKTTSVARKRFEIFRDSQAMTIKLAQTNASSKTEIYAVEVEQRPHRLSSDGVGP